MSSTNKVEKCDCTLIHQDRVEQVITNMPKEEELQKLAQLFKVFGDYTRIKIIHALFECEMCVCDLAYLLDITQSAVSHQLRVLKQSNIVKYRREGKVVYYSLDDAHVQEIFAVGLSHIQHG
ncbi:MAG: helix-turn-helix transcriptional regulator [Epulopiscium sp.]|nr:helix-turn-helix transcriptional regulator [Candidatus Epulonipiscium sp.]